MVGPELTVVPDSRLQGHWLLASLGKKVLRPGGLKLSHQMLEAAQPKAEDRIVEFGPGVGLTASELLAVNPRSYTGIEPNTEGRSKLDPVLAGHSQAKVITAEAAETGLDAESTDLLVGEAMLSMCSPDMRRTIAAEAARILVEGGRYAIHELALSDSAPDPDPKTARGDVSREISQKIKVGATPMKVEAWRQIFMDAGFDIIWQGTAPMHLLEPARFIEDEGIIGSLKFLINMIRRPEARKRVLAMHRSFRARKDDLLAISMVMVKKSH